MNRASCKKHIRNWDANATPVGMTYKGKKSFDTVLGGCLTICLIITMVIITISKIHGFSNNPAYDSHREEFFNELVEQDPITMSKNSSMVAGRLNSNLFFDATSEDMTLID